jgi:prevent-host-death family protein
MEDPMIQIKPISELRNNFPAIEKIVNSGTPVYLTKNGYGTMVVLSLEQYAELTDDVELRLDEADRIAATSQERLTHEEIFSKYRR